MCERHGQEFIGQVCGEGYCSECSNEYQQTLRGPYQVEEKHPGRYKLYAYRDEHGVEFTVDPSTIPTKDEGLKVNYGTLSSYS